MDVDVARPLSIIVDASNLCWSAALAATHEVVSSNRARPPLLGLVLCLNFFEEYRLRHGDVRVVAVAPDWWRRETHMDTEDQAAFEELVAFHRLSFAPKHSHDDFHILALAHAELEGDGESFIVSNDLFRDHVDSLGLSPQWYNAHRVGFDFRSSLSGTLVFLPNLSNLPALNVKKDEMEVLDATTPFFSLPSMWEPARDSLLSAAAAATVEETVELGPSAQDVMGWMIGRKGSRVKHISSKFGCDIAVRGTQVRFSALTREGVELAKSEFLLVRHRVRMEEESSASAGGLDPPARSVASNSMAPLDLRRRNPLPPSSVQPALLHQPADVQSATTSSSVASLDLSRKKTIPAHSIQVTSKAAPTVPYRAATTSSSMAKIDKLGKS